MKLKILISIFIASLLLQVGFALTVQECNDLLKTSGKVDPSKTGNLTPQQIIDCATPDAAKTQEIAPLNIFQIIINAITVLTFGLAVLALIVSAIYIATSAGDKEKYNEGITLAKNAGLAIIIAITAYTILNVVLNTLGFTI